MNKRMQLSVATAVLLAAVTLNAQTSREEMYADVGRTAGLLMPYPGPQQEEMTRPPKGYKPFYISHFGRHGSRWLTGFGTYERAVNTFEAAHRAGALTSTGEDVSRRLRVLYGDAFKRVGELTPLGVQQHRDIADRMYHRHRGVFRPGRKVRAASTGVPRVMMSMRSFCNRLRECEPELDMTLDVAGRSNRFTNSLTKESRALEKAAPWGADLAAFSDSLIRPDRLMALLFSDPEYVRDSINAKALMSDLYSLASICGDMPVDISLYDIFTPEELYDLWQRGNAAYYVTKGPSPVGGKVMHEAARPLLQDFIAKADSAIADGGIAADLRFSHDSRLVPLATMMQLGPSRGVTESYDSIASVWCNYKVSPMAGNIQWIFYRDKSGDVIVKFLLQEAEVDIPVETDIYPYYHWEDVRAFYSNQYNI